METHWGEEVGLYFGTAAIDGIFICSISLKNLF